MRILVIEDEKKVAQALQKGLESEHYEVQVALTGEEGFFLLCAWPFDLIVLDLMLPGRDGMEILRALRKTHDQTPVLILTAREFDILEFLLRNQGHVVIREMLAD